MSAPKKIKKIIRRHRTGAIVIALAIAACGVTMAVAAIDLPGREKMEQTRLEEARRPSGGDRDAPELTEDQESIVKGYGQEEKDAIESLASFKWTGSEGKGRLSFKGNTFSEKTAASEEGSRHSFAVCDIDVNAVTVPQDGSVSETDLTVLLDDGRYSLVRIVASDSGQGRVTTLYSDLFETGGGYTNAFGSSDLTITNLDSKNLSKEVDGNTSDLLKCVREYLSVECSWASEAEWAGTATEDYHAGTVLLPIKVKNVNGSLDEESQRDGTLSVTYWRKDGRFKVTGLTTAE